MKLALLGYGKMGKEIERLTLDSSDFEVVTIIDPLVKENDVTDIPPESTDVVLDFTTGSSVLDNVTKLASMKLDIVIGTTGWDEHIVTPLS